MVADHYPAIRFDTLGDLNKASSRLRAWMLADRLTQLGVKTTCNSGKKFDVYVCQKVHPLRKAKKAFRLGKMVVYDLDDNEFVRKKRHDRAIRKLLKTTSIVTVGSKFLQKEVQKLHPSVHLVDNPVDVMDKSVYRTSRPWTGDLVWFGAPQNLWMLKRLKLKQPVITITHNGDISYDVKTVDHHLINFDLALLPIILNEETRAKNANRLIKCVGLGLPFLASDTSENRRALEKIKLSPSFLVADETAWEAKINRVAQDYPYYQKLIMEARPRVFETYGLEVVARKWLELISAAWIDHQKRLPSESIRPRRLWRF